MKVKDLTNPRFWKSKITIDRAFTHELNSITSLPFNALIYRWQLEVLINMSCLKKMQVQRYRNFSCLSLKRFLFFTFVLVEFKPTYTRRFNSCGSWIIRILNLISSKPIFHSFDCSIIIPFCVEKALYISGGGLPTSNVYKQKVDWLVFYIIYWLLQFPIPVRHFQSGSQAGSAHTRKNSEKQVTLQSCA